MANLFSFLFHILADFLVRNQIWGHKQERLCKKLVRMSLSNGCTALIPSLKSSNNAFDNLRIRNDNDGLGIRF